MHDLIPISLFGQKMNVCDYTDEKASKFRYIFSFYRKISVIHRHLTSTNGSFKLFLFLHHSLLPKIASFFAAGAGFSLGQKIIRQMLNVVLSFGSIQFSFFQMGINAISECVNLHLLIGGFENVIRNQTRLRIYALLEEILTYKIFRTRQTSLFVDSCPVFL